MLTLSTTWNWWNIQASRYPVGPKWSLQSKLLIQKFLPRTPASCERGRGGPAQAWHRPESLPVSYQGLCMRLRFQLASFHREGKGMFVFHPLTHTDNLDCKEIKPVHPKGNQSWMFIRRTDAEAETPNTLATWCEELTHLKRPWCWERLKGGGEGDNRGWDRWLDGITDSSWTGVE